MFFVMLTFDVIFRYRCHNQDKSSPDDNEPLLVVEEEEERREVAVEGTVAEGVAAQVAVAAAGGGAATLEEQEVEAMLVTSVVKADILQTIALTMGEVGVGTVAAGVEAAVVQRVTFVACLDILLMLARTDNETHYIPAALNVMNVLLKIRINHEEF